MFKRRMTPKMVFLTSGVGRHKDELLSFEMALRSAGIEKFNLAQVSSIVPPKCKLVKKEVGIRRLRPGQIVHCVMAKMTSDEKGREIFASIALAIPMDGRTIGYIAEQSGMWKEGADKRTENLAVEMLKNSTKGKIKTASTTIRAKVEDITTTVAVAVFVL